MFKRKQKVNTITFREALPFFLSSLKRVWQLDKKYVIITCFVFTLGAIPDLLGAFVTAIFNQKIISGSEKYVSYIYAYYPLLIVFFVSILDGIFFSIWRWTETKSMDKITAFLLRESVRKAAMIDYASYDDPEFYDRIQKGWAQDGQMFINSASVVFTSISYIVGLGAYISILAYVDWKLLIVIIVLRLCFNPFVNKFYIMSYQLDNKLAELRRKEQYYRSFFGNKEMASEGKLFALFDYAKENYLKAHREIYKETFIYQLKINGINLLSNLIYNFPLIMGYIYLSICVYNGTVSLANMTLFISIYVGFVDQLYNTISEISNVKEYAKSSRFAREFLSLPTSIYTDDDYMKETLSSKSAGHTIEFCNVTFRYPGCKKMCFKI